MMENIICLNCHDEVNPVKSISFQGMIFCGTRCVEHYCKNHDGCHCGSCGIEFCHVPDDCIIEVDGNKFCSTRCRNIYLKERTGLEMLDSKIQGDFDR